MNSGFWAGRRIFVTGHTGFKGGWLGLLLHRLGAEVTGYALEPPTRPSLFEQARVGETLTSITADVCDLAELSAALRAAGPDIVFHLAAQSLVRASYDEPVATFATNVMGTVNVLEAARSVPSIKAIVIATSDKCYDERDQARGYRELDRLGGRDPYASSKACAELVTDAYRRSFYATAAPIASVRAGNVIGGGDWARERIIPDAIRAFLAGQPVAVRNPGSTRPWQHVLEPLAGYLLLAERLVGSDGRGFAEPWNFGPTSDLAVGELVTKLVEAWGDGASWRAGPSEGPHEAGMLQLDATKARDRLGWRPRLSIESSLGWIADWHKTVARGGDARAISEQQIDEYLAGLDG